MTTLHIYTRVSSDSQEDNTSLDNQRKKGMRIAELNGFDFKLWNEGVGSSSRDDLLNRPILTKLLDEIQKGNIKHLYCEYTDRLSRNQKMWGAIRVSLQTNEVLLYNDTDPSPIDLSNATDDLLLGILAEISIFDNRIRTQRLITGKFNRIKEGKWLGGPPVYGYLLNDKMLEENPSESKWVREIYTMYSEKISIEKIRNHLALNGVVTRRGNPIWSHGSIEKILQNQHYIGAYTVKNHKTNETFNCDCPQLISLDLKKKVDEIRENRSYQNRTTQPNQKYEYLLTSKVFCGVCGCDYGVKTFRNAPQKNYYHCKSKERDWRRKKEGRKTYDCPAKGSVKLIALETIVWESIIDTLTKSHIFKEQVKNEVLSKGSHKQSKQEILKREKLLKKFKKDILLINKSIGNLNGIMLLNDDDEQQTNSTINSLIKKRAELKEKLQLENDAIDNQKRDIKWINWLDEFAKRIDNIRHETDIKIRKRFLEGVLDRVEIIPNFNEGLEHQITIKFGLPYYEDSLRNIPNTNVYEVLPGDDKMLVRFEDGKKS